MKPLIKIEIQVPIEIFYGENAFIAHCPIFDVSSQGDTKEEAKENIIDAVTGFIITCYEMGTLSEVLRSSGFIPVAKHEINEGFEFAEDFIDIPLPFMLKDWNPIECPA